MNMKIGFLLILFLAALINTKAQEVSTKKNETNQTLLGLPGDNLDLYAVLDLFQKSKTIEEFEKSLNEEKTGINNLDLNLDKKVDFIKVETKQDNDDFTFVLQVDILDGETQDVAVILVSKDADKKVTIQIVGDEELYGKAYVIEPKLETPAITANPAYSGPDTVVVQSQPATVVVIESEPIIKYVYSPVYVPYYPPYYYGYYPRYFHPYPIVSINIYFGRNRYHHNHYHGGRNNYGGNTVIINNNRTYNNYSKTRNTSNTVNRNKNNGSYKNKRSSNPATTGKLKENRTNNTHKATNKIDRNKPRPNTQKKGRENNINTKKKPASTHTSKASRSPNRTKKPVVKPTSRPASKSVSGKSKGKAKRR